MICKNHTNHSLGYTDWLYYADTMLETHRQRICKKCGFIAVWEKDPEASIIKTSTYYCSIENTK